MRKLIILISLVFVFTGCSVSFSVDTDEEIIEIPNTYGTYQEVVVDVPEDAQRDEITYERIICHYVIEKTGGFTTELQVFVSLDTLADNLEKTEDEQLIDVSLGINDEYADGEKESELLKSALKQNKFVVGVKNLTSGLPTEKTTVKLYFTVEGTYKLF